MCYGVALRFYQNYSKLIKILRIQLKYSADNSPLDNLLENESLLHKPVTLDEVANILQELSYLEQLISRLHLANEEIAELMGQISRSLLQEIKIAIAKRSIEIPAERFQDWLDSNFYVAQHLIMGLGYSAWLTKELSENVGSYYPVMETAAAPLSLLQIVLNRNVRLGFIPPKEWYYRISALHHLRTRDALLQLAYTDLDHFQDIEFQYPGFLAYSVTCFEDLSTFCQLLNQQAMSLLTAPQVMPYLKKAVDYARIINQLDIDFALQVAMLSQFITNLDDLVMVINSYPRYTHLLAVECEQPGRVFTPYAEKDCAQFIKTSKDLARFNLSNIVLQKFIYHIPRLRNLASMADNFLADLQDSIAERMPSHSFSKDKVSVVDPRVLTIGAAINLMQTAEGGGYYTSGTIQFGTDSKKGHFQTYASQGQLLAIALSYRALQIWQQLPIKEYFEIMECGGGEGDLCFKILEFIRQMGAKDAQWATFAKAIHYTILELSPALILRQKERLQAYVSTGVVEIIEDNALQMSHYKKVADLHISNELMDVFAPEQIVIAEATPKVVIAVPVLTDEAYQYLLTHHPDSVLGLINEAADFKHVLPYYAIAIDHEGLVITAARFAGLLNITAKPEFKGPQNCFLFTMSKFPSHFYPEIEQFLTAHEEILFGMQEGDTKIISPALDTYAKLLIQKAKVSILVDYGGCSIDIVNAEFRSYSNSSSVYTHLVLRKAGQQDVTYDVDASVLVSCLTKHNALGKVNLFKMGDLLPPDFAVPEDYKTYCSAESLTYFKHNYFFAVDYIAPETKIRFTDLEKADQGVATNKQYFFQARENARLIVGNNREEIPAAARNQ